MAITQQLNQFAQKPVIGQLDLAVNPTIFTVEVDAALGTPLIPGQLVKLTTTAGGVMKVTASTAVGDRHFGVVRYNAKDPLFQSISPVVPFVEVAGAMSVIYMESSAAIVRGADVSYAGAGLLVKTAVTGDRIVGQALDTATAANQPIRVLLAGTFAGLVP